MEKFQIRQPRGTPREGCAVRGAECRVAVSYVCHHCGLPLCNGPNCHFAEADSAFSGAPLAIHCPDCLHERIKAEGLFDVVRDRLASVVKFFGS
jgi:hypothetical protein